MAPARFGSSASLSSNPSPSPIPSSSFSPNHRFYSSACLSPTSSDIDVLSASYYDDLIIWYENTDGEGTFNDEHMVTHWADGAVSVFALDLDGDGDMDVLSASMGDDKIAWYENMDGQGVFYEQHVISTESDGARFVFAADLDRDGDNDVLSASEYDDKIAWYKNIDGNGTFSDQKVISTKADAAMSLFVSDLDSDGDMDVLSASYSDDKLAWYENMDGQAHFGDQKIISTVADRTRSVIASDLDGDGRMDVLANSRTTIVWYKNSDGYGTFTNEMEIVPSATGARSVYPIDLDSDGDVDVLSASAGDNKIAWYRNMIGLGFSIGQNITLSVDGVASVIPSDLDNDGDLDVLSASSWDGKIAWYQNIDGQGNFGEQRLINTFKYDVATIYTADIDMDGDMDVITGISDYWDHTQGVSWYENIDGLGSFGEEHVITNLAYGTESVITADLDGDGDQDILSASTYDNKISWYRNLFRKNTLVDDFSNPDRFLLGQNFPNPFNPETTIQYYIKEPCRVRLIVFNLNGRFITTLVDKYHNKGEYMVRLQSSDLSSGPYIYRMEAGDFTDVKKMMILK